MKILYSHRGIEGKAGWGRSFYMAKALANLGHDVVFLTNRPGISFLGCRVSVIKKVKVISFPDILPDRVKAEGFGLASLFLKFMYVAIHRFDVVISDCGHRPSGLPCRINRLIFNSIYISEWWDHYGEEGYYKQKSMLFRATYGWIEKWAEVRDKQTANGVVVLSSHMKERALKYAIANVEIIPGGALTDILRVFPFKSEPDHLLTFGYIGMSNSDAAQLAPFFEALTTAEFQGKTRLYSYGASLSEETTRKYSLDGVIVEKGWVDYIKSAEDLRDVDIFLQIHEDSVTARAGWPNKLGDYLALGRAVMIAPYGDLIEFVSANPAGFIDVEYNAESMRRAIRLVLSGGYDLPVMGAANRRLSESISWENRAAKMVDFVGTVASRK